MNPESVALFNSWQHSHAGAKPAEDIAQMARDAARYRWLRERLTVTSSYGRATFAVEMSTGTPASLDSSIDAALERKKAKE